MSVHITNFLEYIRDFSMNGDFVMLRFLVCRLCDDW